MRCEQNVVIAIEDNAFFLMLQFMGPLSSTILCILPKRVRGKVFGEQFIGFIIPFHVCCLFLFNFSSGFLIRVWFYF